MAEEEKENSSSGTDADEGMSLVDDQIIALATLGATAGPPSKSCSYSYTCKITCSRQSSNAYKLNLTDLTSE